MLGGPAFLVRRDTVEVSGVGAGRALEQRHDGLSLAGKVVESLGGVFYGYGGHVRENESREAKPLSEALARFLIGGLVVSAFATVGGLFKPTSFAGLFGAAPSVALATLALAISKDGTDYAGAECRSMMAGAVGLCLYSLLVSQLLARFRLSALKATLFALPFWFLTAFGLWLLFLR